MKTKASKIVDEDHINSDDELLVQKVKRKAKRNPKKKIQVTEEPEQELVLYEYMKARNARICRNKKRLRDLGLYESTSVKKKKRAPKKNQNASLIKICTVNLRRIQIRDIFKNYTTFMALHVKSTLFYLELLQVLHWLYRHRTNMYVCVGRDKYVCNFAL